MPGSTRYFDTIGREAGIPIEGFAVIGYKLRHADERRAYFEPQSPPEGVESGEILVQKEPGEAAPERILGLFDTSARQ